MNGGTFSDFSSGLKASLASGNQSLHRLNEKFDRVILVALVKPPVPVSQVEHIDRDANRALQRYSAF